MIVIIDSREQTPFRFSENIQTETAALSVGDYSIKGLEDQITIERKSLSDLLGSITGGRERFTKELRQLRAFRFAALVIESDWMRIVTGAYPQDVSVNAIIGSLMAFSIKYGVVPIMAGDHHAGGLLTERLLLNFARIVESDHKKLVTDS